MDTVLLAQALALVLVLALALVLTLVEVTELERVKVHHEHYLMYLLLVSWCSFQYRALCCSFFWEAVVVCY